MAKRDPWPQRFIREAVATWVAQRFADAESKQQFPIRPMFAMDPMRFAQGPPIIDWRQELTGPELGADLRSHLKRHGQLFLVKTAWTLSQPTDEQILDLATALLPWPYGPGLELLRDGVIIAGSTNAAQRRRAEDRAAQEIVGFGVRSMLGALSSSTYLEQLF